jgi:hypothetical protein
MTIELDTQSFAVTFANKPIGTFSSFPDAFIAIWGEYEKRALSGVPETLDEIHGITRLVPTIGAQDELPVRIDFHASCELAYEIELLLPGDIAVPFEPADLDEVNRTITHAFNKARVATILGVEPAGERITQICNDRFARD